MSTPRHPAEQKSIELKFNSNATSAPDTQTITSIPLPQHKEVHNTLVLKDGRIAILERNNLAIYSDTAAFERPPAISIYLDLDHDHDCTQLLGKMIELSENQIICYRPWDNDHPPYGAFLCDLSNKSVKFIELPGAPKDIVALDDTQFIARTITAKEDIGFIFQAYLSLFRSDANGSFNEISRLDLSPHNHIPGVDRIRLFCPIPATTTVIIEDINNLGHFNAFKQVDKKGWDNNERTTLPYEDIYDPLSLYAITANSNGELLLSFQRFRDEPHNFCIIDSAFQSSRNFHVNEFKGQGVSLVLVDNLIFLPDAKTMVAPATNFNRDTRETTYYLLTLNIDHGYSFVKIPSRIRDLSLLPSGEILITGNDYEAFFSTFDSKYMKEYRAQIAQHTADVTRLPSALGNIVQSYLFHPSIHSQKQRVAGTPMQPDVTMDDPLSEADINPVSPEVKLVSQSNVRRIEKSEAGINPASPEVKSAFQSTARRIDDFVKNATAYIKNNQSSSLFHDANSPKNIAETTFLKRLISRLTSPESKSISTAEIKGVIHTELALCYTEHQISAETIITPVRFSGLGRVGVESLLERLLNSVSAVAQIKAERIEVEKLDPQLRSTASSSSISSTSSNKRGQQ